MTRFEAFRVALSGLLSNRMRAILTTLGIVIGVAAVIRLIALGRGVENYIASEFEDLGSNLLIVIPQEPTNPNRTRREPLTTNEARDLLDPSIAPSIADLAVSFQTAGSVKAGSESYATNIVGVSTNILTVRSWSVRPGGQFFSENDLQTTARVAVLGVGAVEELYGDKTYDPLRDRAHQRAAISGDRRAVRNRQGAVERPGRATEPHPPLSRSRCAGPALPPLRGRRPGSAGRQRLRPLRRLRPRASARCRPSPQPVFGCREGAGG